MRRTGPGVSIRCSRTSCSDDETIATGLEEGWLVEETDLLDYLLACPGRVHRRRAPPGSRAWPRERREAALAELREDGMYVISRYMQTVASKKRKRHRHARKLKQLRARLKESNRSFASWNSRSRDWRSAPAPRESPESRWWRMRPRLPARRLRTTKLVW